MRTEDGHTALVVVGAVLMVALAGLVPTRPLAHTPPDTLALRSQLAGVPNIGATVLWLRAVDQFSRVAAKPTPGATGSLAADLTAATRLDPAFDEPWIAGVLMLAVVEGGPGPSGTQLRHRGSQQRPDLPWHLVPTQ